LFIIGVYLLELIMIGYVIGQVLYHSVYVFLNFSNNMYEYLTKN